MPKKQQMPGWLEQVYGELLKPPHFLQQQRPPSESKNDHSESIVVPTAGGLKENLPKTRIPSSEGTHASGHVHRSGSSASKSPQSNEIPEAVLSRYPIQVERRDRQVDILRVITSEGKRYALKKTGIPLPHVRFIHRFLAFARRQGFNRFNRFLLTQKKGPACMYDGDVYYATEWVDGQSANFASTEHVAQTAYTLAQFHEATRGFKTDKYAPPSAFDLFSLTQQRNRDLHQMMIRAEAKEAKDSFDELFVSLKPQLFEDAAQSLQLLQQHDCEMFLREDQENPGISHLDVIPGNCLYTPEHVVYLIDFELSTFAPRALDAAHLLRRSLQLTNWNGDVAYACFLHFNAVRSMPQAEYQVVQALLQFPYRAWRLAHTRYHFYADAAQTHELRDYASQESRRQMFLSSLSDQIRNLKVDAT